MLLLREDEYKSLAGSEKTLYLLQWLQELPQAIRDTDKVLIILAIIIAINL